MSWGYVAVAAATVISGAMSSRSARKANKSAESQSDRQMQMYYDSPQYQAGAGSLPYLLGDKSRTFDSDAYLKANPDVQQHIDSGDAQRYGWDMTNPAQFHYQNYGSKEGRQGFFNEPKEGLLSMFYNNISKSMQNPNQNMYNKPAPQYQAYKRKVGLLNRPNDGSF